jgi:uncharacterized protein (UPF0264 family)
MKASKLQSSFSGLIISVRSAEEAEIALAGGANLIDVKDPLRGTLGKAEDDVIAAVVREVDGHCPVSAAIGELVEHLSASPRSSETIGENGTRPVLEAIPDGVSWLKVGLAGCGARADWQDRVEELRHQVEAGGTCRLVVAAYADWRRAGSPEPEEVVSYVLSRRASALLIDTWGKDGTTLLDWMQMSDAIRICHHFRQARIPITLSGALGLWQIRELRLAKPNWFAVRGSVCSGSIRDGKVERERVQRLVAELK